MWIASAIWIEPQCRIHFDKHVNTSHLAYECNNNLPYGIFWSYLKGHYLINNSCNFVLNSNYNYYHKLVTKVGQNAIMHPGFITMSEATLLPWVKQHKRIGRNLQTCIFLLLQRCSPPPTIIRITIYFSTKRHIKIKTCCTIFFIWYVTPIQ